jgi:hypothetical protein
VVLPLLLEARPRVAAAEIAASHQLAVESVANTFHLVPLVDVRDDLHVPLFQPFDEVRCRRPAADHVVHHLLKHGARARLPRALRVLHFGLRQVLTHRLPARNDRGEIELLGQFPRDLFGTIEVLRVADRPALVVDGRGEDVKLAVVVLVADGEPQGLVEAHPLHAPLGHPRLRFRRDAVFFTCADGEVEDIAFDLRVAAGDGFKFTSYFLDGATRHVPGDQLAPQLAFGLLVNLFFRPGRRLRALKVFLPLGAVAAHLR